MVTSSARTFVVATSVALMALFVSAVSSRAACDPTTDPDKTDIANARAAISANCDCAGATTHGTYVRCAVQQVNAVLTNRSCAGFVKKCASHSTCGKPNAVTCCITTAKGTACKVKRDATHCTAKQGSVGTCASCCDACGANGCAATTTTTSSTSSTTFPSPCGPGAGGVCGGSCPSPEVCIQDPASGVCFCDPGPCRAIGGFGSCGGTCTDPAAVCSLVPGACACIVPCMPAGCGGTCANPTQVCAAPFPEFPNACVCVPGP